MPKKAYQAKQLNNLKTRNNILEASVRNILEGENFLFNIREVAKIAGYSYGTLYKYFKSPEELKEAVFSYQLQKLQALILDSMLQFKNLMKPQGQIVLQILKKDSKKEQVIVLIHAYLDLMKKIGQMFLLDSPQALIFQNQSLSMVGFLLIQHNDPSILKKSDFYQT